MEKTVNLLKGTKRKYTSLVREMLFVMRSYIPIDTGNMSNNAVYYQRRPNGFAIVFDEKYAPYMKIVNEGLYKNQTPKITQNKGFVDRAILAGASIIVSKREPFRFKKYAKQQQAIRETPLGPAFVDVKSLQDRETIAKALYSTTGDYSEKEIKEQIEINAAFDNLDLYNLKLMTHKVIQDNMEANAKPLHSVNGMVRALARFKNAINVNLSKQNNEQEESEEE